MDIREGDNYAPELALDESLDIPYSHREPDDDFLYMKSLFQLPDCEWEVGMNYDHLKIYRMKQTAGSLFMVKIIANLTNIPKEVAFQAIADLNIRKKWDYILSSMTIVEWD